MAGIAGETPLHRPNIVRTLAWSLAPVWNHFVESMQAHFAIGDKQEHGMSQEYMIPGTSMKYEGLDCSSLRAPQRGALAGCSLGGWMQRRARLSSAVSRAFAEREKSRVMPCVVTAYQYMIPVGGIII